MLELLEIYGPVLYHLRLLIKDKLVKYNLKDILKIKKNREKWHISFVVATIEYYRQLLLGSQAHQLQMMGTTMQQCCQLLWSQQRELQSMRAAIAELQLRSQNQAPQRINNAETQEEHSNLSRSIHNLGDTLDTTLPPSSSLPNLVSLPNSSAALSHTPIVSSNLQQQQQQQLNNQVPPGNRANNYWDNFRR